MEDALNAVQENDEKLVDQYTSSMFYHLLPFIIKEPPVKINESCHGPEFSMFDCDLLHRIFNGTRQENAKIAVGFKFGFEADVQSLPIWSNSHPSQAQQETIGMGTPTDAIPEDNIFLIGTKQVSLKISGLGIPYRKSLIFSRPKNPFEISRIGIVRRKRFY